MNKKMRKAIVEDFHFVVEVELRCPYCKEYHLVIVESPYHDKIHKCIYCKKEFKTEKFKL